VPAFGRQWLLRLRSAKASQGTAWLPDDASLRSSCRDKLLALPSQKKPHFLRLFVAPSPLLRLLADSRGTAGLPDDASLRSSCRDILLTLPSQKKPHFLRLFVAPSGLEPELF
jgi:hypothetical protein